MKIKLEDYLANQLQIEPALVKDLVAIGNTFSMNPKERLLQKGFKSSRVYFIEQGVVREYEDIQCNNKIKEKTTWIVAEGQWVYNIESHQTGQPSAYHLQALEPTTGYFFHRRDLDKLIESYEWLFIQNQIYLSYVVRERRINRLLRVNDGYARLQLFEQMYPELRGRVELQHIASYLNMTPTQLSRLRRLRKHK